jgi:DNA-binding MarR family transcriptional regulator
MTRPTPPSRPGTARPPRHGSGAGTTPSASDGIPGFPLAILLQHTGKLLDDQVRQQLDELGVHPGQGHVLRLLAARDGVTQAELTRLMRLAAPTVSGILGRMEAAGLVVRRPDPRDERLTRVRLTPSGRAVSRAVHAAVGQVEHRLTAGLSRAQQRAAHRLLRRLRDNLGGHRPDDEPPVSRVVP